MNETQSRQNEMAHQKEMRMVNMIGAVLIICAISLNLALLGLTLWLFYNNSKEIAYAVALFNTVAGIVTTCIAYLAPSPLSNARRSSDSNVQPAGTPNDPIATAEVGSAKKEEIQSQQVEPQPSKLVVPEDLTDEDFEPTDPYPRGLADNNDPDFFAEETDEEKAT